MPRLRRDIVPDTMHRWEPVGYLRLLTQDDTVLIKVLGRSSTFDIYLTGALSLFLIKFFLRWLGTYCQYSLTTPLRPPGAIKGLSTVVMGVEINGPLLALVSFIYPFPIFTF